MVILDLRKLETLTDYFVICTAEVDQQIRAVAKNIEDQVKTATGERVFHREGMEALNWVLLDYVDVVVHIFKPSFREFYKLEDLWGDAEAIPVVEKSAGRTTVTVKRRAAVTAKKEEVKPTRTRKTTAKDLTEKKAPPKKTTPRKTAVKKTETARKAGATKPKTTKSTTKKSG